MELFPPSCPLSLTWSAVRARPDHPLTLWGDHYLTSWRDNNKSKLPLLKNEQIFVFLFMQQKLAKHALKWLFFFLSNDLYPHCESQLKNFQTARCGKEGGNKNPVFRCMSASERGSDLPEVTQLWSGRDGLSL